MNNKEMQRPWVLLRTYRRKAGLTQQQLASGIFSQSTLSKIEQGKRAPAVDDLESLAPRLGREPRQLVQEWQGVLQTIHIYRCIWKLICTVEATRQHPEETEVRLANLSRMLRRYQSRLLLYDDYICRGYLQARQDAYFLADSTLLKARFCASERESEGELPFETRQYVRTIEAFARFRIAEGLGRHAAANFWRRRIYRQITKKGKIIFLS